MVTGYLAVLGCIQQNIIHHIYYKCHQYIHSLWWMSSRTPSEPLQNKCWFHLNNDSTTSIPQNSFQEL